MNAEETRQLYRDGGWLDRGGGIHESGCRCMVCDPAAMSRPREEIDSYPQLAADPEAPVAWWGDPTRGAVPADGSER